MYGREYANHLDILLHSFGQINSAYEKKIDTKKRASGSIEKLKKLYISIFGIPEIGFQIRSAYFKQILQKYLSNINPQYVLDAGCGIGSYTFLLGKNFKSTKVTGGDIDKDKLRSCKKMVVELNSKNTTFIHLDLTKLQKTTTYDLIVTIDVLEHIDNYELVLKNFSRVLRKGGYLYIHVPQPHQQRIFGSMTQWHHEDHIHEGISQKTLEKVLKKLGFNILASKETFGFFGKLAWELNHLMLSKSFVLAGIGFPILYAISLFDQVKENKHGLGVALLAQKK